MPAAVVQRATVQTGAWGTGTTFAMPGNATSGNHIIVVMTHSYLGCPPSCTDSQGNTYTARTSGTLQPTGGQRMWVFTAPVGSNAALTVTVAMGCGNAAIGYVAEISGLNATTPYEAAAVSANTVNPVQSGSVTTTVNGSYVVSLMYAGAGSPTYTPGSGFTERYDTAGYFVQDVVQSTAGAINPAATVTSNAADVYGYTAAFRAASGSSVSRAVFPFFLGR